MTAVLARPLALELFERKAGRALQPGDIVVLEPDSVMSHDNTAFIQKSFRETGATRVWKPERVVIVFDHCVPAVLPAHALNHEQARRFVAEQGIEHFFDAGAGICHQVMMERGLVQPGELILGADSHSTLYGAMGALGIPINRTEMAGVWATGEIWLKVPESIRVELTGALPNGVFAKDLVLALLAELGADGAAYQALEFTGPGARAMGMSERMTLCNMAVELGAKCGLFAPDAVTRAFLDAQSVANGAQPAPAMDFETDAGDERCSPSNGYARSLTIALDTLEPQIACPHTVDNVHPIQTVAGRPVHHAYLGSCTNGRLEDLHIAAALLRTRTVAAHVQLHVYPASDRIAQAAERDGTMDTLRAAGAHIMGASCGPCFGAVGAILEAGQACISSSNRNFRGRMGSEQADVYLASPATVAASAIMGCLTDPRTLS